MGGSPPRRLQIFVDVYQSRRSKYRIRVFILHVLVEKVPAVDPIFSTQKSEEKFLKQKKNQLVFQPYGLADVHVSIFNV